MKQVAVTLLLICSLAAAADTLKGVVQNSTTNKPSAGDEVTLKKIGSGMEDVAKTKTNAKGEFSFNVPAAQQPYIVWVQHQGVTYTQAGLPGGVPVAVRVFDASPKRKRNQHSRPCHGAPDLCGRRHAQRRRDLYGRQSILSAPDSHRTTYDGILSAGRSVDQRIQRSDWQNPIESNGDSYRRKKQVCLRFSDPSGTNAVSRHLYGSVFGQTGNRSAV